MDRIPVSQGGRLSRWKIALMLSAAALVFAGCPRRGPEGQPPGQPTPPPPSAQVVNVSMREWAFDPSPLVARAGRTTFTIKNDGAVEHNFLIENKAGAQIEAIQPGASKTLDVELTPGQYTIFCNLPGHREAGMVGTLRVQQ